MTPRKKHPTRSENLDSKRSCRVQQSSCGTMRDQSDRGLPSRLSSEESKSLFFALELATQLLLQDQPCLPTSAGQLKRSLMNALANCDGLGFIEACSWIRLALVRTGSWELALSKVPWPRWVRGIVSAIESAVQPTLIVHPSPAFTSVANFLGWFKRIPVMIRDTRDGIDDYFRCDRRISSINFDENVYVPMLEEIWTEWFDRFELSDPFLPKHGSGSTADAGRVRHKKWRNLQFDDRARILLHNSAMQEVLDGPFGPSDRTAKVVFVPKQAGKDRAICMEPAWLQYLQQGVAQQLVDYSSRHKTLGRLVNIQNQDVNRELCSRAYTGGFATIDLTDASDSVSWRLICKLTHRLPLRRYLCATRSVATVIDGRRIEMDKFAPMGSALCFPIECYLFASVVELAYRIHYGEASSGHLSGCSVYGDDIICPGEIYNLVVDILTSLGFIVNEDKSYSSGPYYESCGVEYIYGARLFTVKHPRSLLASHQEMSPDRVGTVTDLANSLLANGYYVARRHLLCEYAEGTVMVHNKRLPFMDLMVFDDKNCIPVIDPYNTLVWNDSFQASGVIRWSVETRQSRANSDFLEKRPELSVQSRKQRICRRREIPLRISPDDKWSQEAVTFLSKIHFWDLLQEGDVETAGRTRTGRLHHKARKRFRAV